MSYRIEYDLRIGKYEVRRDKSKKHALTPAITGLGIITVVMLLCPGVGTALRALIIPGDDIVTVQAFRNMTADMRSGASLTDAVYTFCHYVIHGT